MDGGIVEAFASIGLAADGDGSIPLFGGKPCILPSGVWIAFLEKLLSSVPRAQWAGTETRIQDAAAAYCYHFAHAVIESGEFRGAASHSGTSRGTASDPGIPEPARVLGDFFHLLSAWGWADAEIAFLEPGKKLVVHAHSYFEADIRHTFPADRPLAFILQGMCRALMDLGFAAPYPGGFPTFTCIQTRAVELGDPYGEFVVTRRDAP